MTYTINFTGSVSNDTEEKAVLQKAEEFAATLDGITSSQFIGEYSGIVSLTPGEETVDDSDTPEEETEPEGAPDTPQQ